MAKKAPAKEGGRQEDDHQEDHQVEEVILPPSARGNSRRTWPRTSYSFGLWLQLGPLKTQKESLQPRRRLSFFVGHFSDVVVRRPLSVVCNHNGPPTTDK